MDTHDKPEDTHDELNRITIKTYSDGTPQVSYSYDVQPGDSPITYPLVLFRIGASFGTLFRAHPISRR